MRTTLLPIRRLLPGARTVVLAAAAALIAAGCGSGQGGSRPPADTNAVSAGIRQAADRADALEAEARGLLVKIAEMEKSNFEGLHTLHHNLGCVYKQAGRFSEAEREYLEALRLQPAAADTQLGLGILYETGLKQPDKARACFERFLALAPGSMHATEVRERLAKLPAKQDREGMAK